MPAPLAKGLIIAASVLVAAGIAIYESPQVRQWVDQSRRKIAIALHSLGDEIQPRRNSESSEEFEARRRKEEALRRRRNELVKRAREEGVAVDLDELAKIGREEERPVMRERRKTGSSFDDLVGSDGMLKKESNTTGIATATDSTHQGARKRDVHGFKAGASPANSFTRSQQVLFDNDQDEAPSPNVFEYIEAQSRESSATVEGTAVSPPAGQLIDLTPENPQTASIPASVTSESSPLEQSFHSFTSTSSRPLVGSEIIVDDFDEVESTGTLTPRSEHSAFTNASVVPSHADDVAVLSLQSDDDHDARSEVFSEGGFSEIGSDRHHGVMTPSSWTDVGSDDESEWGGPAQGGQVHQGHSVHQ